MINANEIVGAMDVLLITIDTLRYDVAQTLWSEGRTPNLASVLPASGWELRHTPASFTYAAHQAFFAGFLPTPAAPGRHPRLFAARFAGSETCTDSTCAFDAENIVAGFAGRGYHTVCIGGVGFFNPLTPLGSVLPGLFHESHWSVATGVTDPNSTAHQAELVDAVIRRLPAQQRLFLFINISAVHQPNCFYLPGAAEDSLASHAAALEYVDRQLPRIFTPVQSRGRAFVILCSDHGSAYGEDGYQGHRLAHPVVWNVPYAEFFMPARQHEGGVE